MSPTAIDLFAGAGGFSSGATAAGLRVAWAANHWPAAVKTHAANHPATVHACQDLQQADFALAPPHDVLLASPSCTGHTRARGRDLPRHDAARATAWAVVTAAEVHRPRALIVENVPEFRAWALYPAWRMALGALGYHLEEHVLDAADFGVPQHRVRLFLVGQRGAPKQLRRLRVQRHQPIGPLLDWSDKQAWSPVDRPGRSAATLARVERARRELGDRFVMPYYGSGSGQTGRSLDRPLGTVTTRARWAVVAGERMRMLSPAELAAAMGFPPEYLLPARKDLAIHLLGNAVCPPVAEALCRAVLDVLDVL